MSVDKTPSITHQKQFNQPENKRVQDQAHELEKKLAEGASDQFAKQIHNLKDADFRQAIAAQISTDSKDPSLKLPHVEFTNTGEVKAIDRQTPGGGRTHEEFDP